MFINFLSTVYEKLYLLRHKGKRLDSFENYKHTVINKKGLEIGGPSRIFKKKLPIYYFSRSLDGVNFSTHTLWENNLQDSGPFNYFFNRVGTQYIREATFLEGIKCLSYDFIASSHCLEHIANPLKALKEWNRVIKNNGFLILVLPRKMGNFDRKRKFTSFDHILKDYRDDTQETDLTHLDEIIEYHDFSLDKNSESINKFIERGKNNYKIRGLHHHVFNEKLIIKMLDWSGFNLLHFERDKYNYFVLASKKD